MNYKVNTVIIGGGPAGTACGNYLQAKGISSMIIEKKSFPREKLCAGIITNKTYRQITRLWELKHKGEPLPEDIFCSATPNVRLYSGNDLLVRTHASEPFRFVKRMVFDNFLAELYTSSGGKLLENCCCKEIDTKNRRLTLNSGDTVTYRHLVAADGALSPTRKMLGAEKPVLAFCLETRIPKPANVKEVPVSIFFGAIECGYVWIFPSGDQICIGLGCAYQEGKDYRAMFADFLRKRHINAPESEWKGAFVPYGECTDQSGLPSDAVLIGDAGGFVDPINGEGLYFALSTGIEAARAVIRSMRKGTGFRPEFIKATDKYARTIRQTTRIQKLVLSGKFWKIVKNRIRNKRGLTGYYLDHLVHEYDYTFPKIWKMIIDYKLQK